MHRSAMREGVRQWKACLPQNACPVPCHREGAGHALLHIQQGSTGCCANALFFSFHCCQQRWEGRERREEGRLRFRLRLFSAKSSYYARWHARRVAHMSIPLVCLLFAAPFCRARAKRVFPLFVFRAPPVLFFFETAMRKTGYYYSCPRLYRFFLVFRRAATRREECPSAVSLFSCHRAYYMKDATLIIFRHAALIIYIWDKSARHSPRWWHAHEPSYILYYICCYIYIYCLHIYGESPRHAFSYSP